MSETQFNIDAGLSNDSSIAATTYPLPTCPEFSRIASDVTMGKGVRVFAFVNLYGCSIGENSRIGTFVEIQKNVEIGRNVKVSSHTFICEGVQIGDDVFVGHNVSFINDKFPRAISAITGEPQTEADWQVVRTVVKRGASIGTSCTILCGVTIGEFSVVGAGSVVTHDVPPNTVVAGNPARLLRTMEER
jgi:acetyltransferase-like isoleucine patch superfamily enzyme